MGVSEDFLPRSAIYATLEEAEAQALKQIALYETWQREGRVRLLEVVDRSRPSSRTMA